MSLRQFGFKNGCPQAFDRVNYYKLFNRLLNRDISPILLRLLLYICTRR